MTDGKHSRRRHAMPPAEGATLRNRLRRRVTVIVRARPSVVAIRSRLVRGFVAPRTPNVGAEMIPTRETPWTWSLRAVRNPAYGIAAMTYVLGAWIVVGAISPPPTEVSPPGSDDATASVTGSTSFPGRTARRQQVDPESHSAPPAVTVDAQFFDGLQTVLNGLDSLPEGPRTSSQPAIDGPSTGIAVPTDVAATATPPDTPPAALPSEAANPSASDVPTPAIEPNPLPALPPNDPSAAGVPTPVIAPSPLPTPPPNDPSAGPPAAVVPEAVVAPGPPPNAPLPDGQPPAN